MLHGRHDRKIDPVVLRVRQSNCQQLSHVVPANAGTRNPEGQRLKKVSATALNRYDAASGSRRSPDDVLDGSILVGLDLVKERVAQAVGVGIPLARPLVG